MNAIRSTAALNKRELEHAIPPSASWHADYRDTAYIYIGGLPASLSEGDVVTIFSQYGNPTHLNLVRDKETGKSKGFAFLKYEDQRSCDLAVDNLGGAEVPGDDGTAGRGRLLRVDHTRYKRREGEDEETYRIDRLEAETSEVPGRGTRGSETEDSEDERRKRRRTARKTLKEERELAAMLQITAGDGEDEDPMRGYLIAEKKADLARARARDGEKRHRHRHRDRDHDGHGDKERRHLDRDRDREDARDDGRRRQRPDEDGDDRRERHRRRDEDDRRDRERKHPRRRDDQYSDDDRKPERRHPDDRPVDKDRNGSSEKSQPSSRHHHGRDDSG